MSHLHDIADFRRRLLEIIEDFRAQEDSIRTQYKRALTNAPTAITEKPQYLLERATRRFLIDRVLAALGWNPDDPDKMSEEARALTDNMDRLYFDYLGLAPRTGFPVAIVEAKGFDLPMPSTGSAGPVDSREVVRLIVEGLEAIKSDKTDETTGTLPAHWTEWLRDLFTYVKAISDQPTLSRVVLTAGRWFVVFADPLTAFGSGRVRPDDVFCFSSFDEMVTRHEDLFRLLNRSRVVDTLPLVMDVREALKMIRAKTITECYRAVAVATTTTGTRRRPYPTRSVYPAIVVITANRCFGIVDWDTYLEEPRESETENDYSAFFAALEANGERLLQRVSGSLGVPALKASPLSSFRGFARTDTLGSEFELIPPVSGPDQSPQSPTRRHFVVPINQGPKAGSEYLVVTGTTAFYKEVAPSGGECRFHVWKTARAERKAAEHAVVLPTETSFTLDGQVRHCAHEDLRVVRESRCHIDVLERHVCCRTCVFQFDCWSSDTNILPCPTI